MKKITNDERATINRAVAIMQDKLDPNASFMFSIRKEWFTQTVFDSLGRQHAINDRTDDFAAVVDVMLEKQARISASPDSERDETIAYHRLRLAELTGAVA